MAIKRQSLSSEFPSSFIQSATHFIAHQQCHPLKTPSKYSVTTFDSKFEHIIFRSKSRSKVSVKKPASEILAEEASSQVALTQ